MLRQLYEIAGIRMSMEEIMNFQQFLEQQETEKADLPRLALKVFNGGNDGHNWLLEKPKGTIFLCREKSSNKPDLLQFRVLRKKGFCVKLDNGWKDSRIFSDQYLCVEVLHYGKGYVRE